VTATRYVLRRQWQLFRSAEPEGTGWPLPAALVVLGVATIATAFVSETLIGALQAFAYIAHLSEFFVAFVIVAIIGNATEHGSAVLLARRGRVTLATEIPLASSAQIAGLVIALIALLSWGLTPLALSFRPIELTAMAIAAALPALVLRTGRTTRPSTWMAVGPAADRHGPCLRRWPSGLADRVTVRREDVTSVDEADSYDCAWFPPSLSANPC
jgi:Ca2+:H+ antiporter